MWGRWRCGYWLIVSLLASAGHAACADDLTQGSVAVPPRLEATSLSEEAEHLAALRAELRAPQAPLDDAHYARKALDVLAWATENGDRAAVAEAQLALAGHYRRKLLHGLMLDSATAALEAARAGGEHALAVEAEIERGGALQALERTQEAADQLFAALAEMDQLGMQAPLLRMRAMLSLSSAFGRSGHYDTAFRFVEAGLEIARSAGHAEMEARLLASRSRIAQAAGDLDSAARDLERASEIQLPYPTPELSQSLLLNGVTLALDANDLDRAERLAQQAGERARALSSPYMEAFAAEMSAVVQCRRGEHEVALAGFERAQRLWVSQDQPADMARLMHQWAHCLEAVRQHPEAVRKLESAIHFGEISQQRRNSEAIVAAEAHVGSEREVRMLAELRAENASQRAQLASERLWTSQLVLIVVLTAMLVLLIVLRVRWVEAANRSLRQSHDLRTRMLAQISHEVRNPGQALVGVLESMLVEAQSRRDRKRLESALQAARMVQRIGQDFLDLARLEQGQAATQMDQVVELPRLLEQTAELVRPMAQERGLHLRCIGIELLPQWIALDGDRLREVLLNLLGNAVHYSGRGSIELRARMDAADLCIEVQDCGPGLKEQDLRRLFDPYYRGSEGRASRGGGSGLGLAIAHGWVKAMGGSLSASNAATGGAVFSLRIPTQVAQAPVSTVSSVSVRGERVIVLDDDDGARIGMVALLQSLGCEVLELASAGSLRTETESFAPSLVLIDRRLGTEDGLEVAARLKRECPVERCPRVVMVSGDPAPTDVARETAVDAWLQKPVAREALVALLAAETEALPDLDHDPVLDRRALQQLSGLQRDGTSLDQVLVRNFLHGSDARYRAILAAAGVGDMATLADLAHAWKSSVRMIGLLELGAALEWIEEDGRAERPLGREVVQRRLEAALLAARAALSTEITAPG